MDEQRKQRRSHIRGLRAAGVSFNDAKLTVPEGTPGYSSSNVGVEGKKDAEECLGTIKARRFDGPGELPIVAAYMDATWIGKDGKKDGARRKKEEEESNQYEVMVIVGVRADGTKVALNLGVTKDERSEDIYPLLADVAKRGVDPRILWIADHRSGIRKALEQLTHPDLPQRQGCTTHAAGNMAALLPKEMSKAEKEPWRLQMYGAWTEPDAAVARERLEGIASDLEAAGHNSSARSLRLSMESTLTVHRLVPEGDLREQLRSTNAQESVNSGIKGKGSIPNLTYIKDEPMALRHVAQRLVWLEEKSWNRVAEPEVLVGLMDKLMPERYDAAAILDRLPPTYKAKPLTVTIGKDKRMKKIATDWCAKNPEANWIGSPGALEALGLDAGKERSPAALVEAMRCRNPKGKHLRRIEKVTVERLDSEGNSVKDLVPGILNLSWELAAPPSAMREWHRGGSAREQIEAKFVAAASAAIDQGTRTTSEHDGFAGIMALQRPPPNQPEQPLRVVGITFAVQHGREARFSTAVPDAALEPKTARAAEDAAKDVLDGKEREPETPAAVPPPRAPARTGPEQGPLSAELIAGVEARALELAPRMVAAARKDLETHARGLPLVTRSLGMIEAEVSEWRQQSWESAARQVAAARARPQSPSSPRRDAWRPLSPGQRLVLGEKRAQWLLGDAALLAGRAEADPEVARGLREANEDALAGLNEPVARAAAAAEALAARRELERRRLFEAAREASGGEPPPVQLRDSRGVLELAPVDRYHRALGSERTAALRRYAKALEPEVKAMDEATLRRLSAATERAWTEFDPAEGLRLAKLESNRGIALGERLEALRDVGRETTVASQAEQKRKAELLFAADDRTAVAMRKARGSWETLRELEDKLSEGRQLEGSPAILANKHPEAAVHHAAKAVLLGREQALEPASAVETGRPREALGLEP